ncbi:MAG: hypothetical protein HY558_05400 [Euryarchaeota archaeon]|nr:hypothetical protein [Euryarchaeota archaeon]
MANTPRIPVLILAATLAAILLSGTALAYSTAHLDKMAQDGVKWVRSDVRPSDKDGGNSIKFASAAKARGLNVIAIIKSDDFKPYASYWYWSWGCWCWRYYDWGAEWSKQVQKVASELKPYGVKTYQVDNELNHPYWNTYTYANYQLRKDIVTIGAKAVKKVDPYATTAVNLIELGTGTLNFDIDLYKQARSAGAPLDILGLDTYRGTYTLGSPTQYASDVDAVYSRWQGNVMIMETGFPTAWPHTEADQQNYVNQVFTTMKNHLSTKSWFRGIVFYEYLDEPGWLQTEATFGLTRSDGISEKPAWDTFTAQISATANGKMVGVAYHI